MRRLRACLGGGGGGRHQIPCAQRYLAAAGRRRGWPGAAPLPFWQGCESSALGGRGFSHHRKPAARSAPTSLPQAGAPQTVFACGVFSLCLTGAAASSVDHSSGCFVILSAAKDLSATKLPAPHTRHYERSDWTPFPPSCFPGTSGHAARNLSAPFRFLGAPGVALTPGFTFPGFSLVSEAEPRRPAPAPSVCRCRAHGLRGSWLQPRYQPARSVRL